jgi:hypothetical protein
LPYHELLARDREREQGRDFRERGERAAEKDKRSSEQKPEGSTDARAVERPPTLESTFGPAHHLKALSATVTRL